MTATRPPPRARWLKRGGAALKWLGPSLAIALMPKCPVCLAGYVAVATGLGLSVSAAAHLRWALLALCAASLVYLTVRLLTNRRCGDQPVHESTR